MADFDTKLYDTNANCYGYATNVNNCGAAAPGGEGVGPDVQDYFERLIAGVLDDGQGRVTQKSRTLDGIPVPAANHYLILLTVGGTGFHFLRRETDRPGLFKRRRWSWKNGTGEPHSYWNACTTKGKYTTITNGNLKSAIQNPQQYAWGTSAGGQPPLNAKVCFFEVAQGGFDPARVQRHRP